MHAAASNDEWARVNCREDLLRPDVNAFFHNCAPLFYVCVVGGVPCLCSTTSDFRIAVPALPADKCIWLGKTRARMRLGHSRVL